MSEYDVCIGGISRRMKFLIDESKFLLLLRSEEPFLLALACLLVLGLVLPPGWSAILVMLPYLRHITLALDLNGDPSSSKVGSFDAF